MLRRKGTWRDSELAKAGEMSKAFQLVEVILVPPTLA
jgi:hypothetical protein